MARSPRPVRGVERHPDATVDPAAWPDSVPAVTQLLTRGLDLPPGVTFPVGANGAGGSTVVEAVTEVLGVHPDGGRGRQGCGTPSQSYQPLCRTSHASSP
jgi:predicted ATPase